MADPSITTRKRKLCEHCGDMVSLSTYYRHHYQEKLSNSSSDDDICLSNSRHGEQTVELPEEGDELETEQPIDREESTEDQGLCL